MFWNKPKAEVPPKIEPSEIIVGVLYFAERFPRGKDGSWKWDFYRLLNGEMDKLEYYTDSKDNAEKVLAWLDANTLVESFPLAKKGEDE